MVFFLNKDTDAYEVSMFLLTARRIDSSCEEEEEVVSGLGSLSGNMLLGDLIGQEDGNSSPRYRSRREASSHL